jgi:hypothetical protein
MSQHRDHDSEPQLVFKRNFHESGSGWFLPGHPLTISYDPARIVPPGDDYRFGDPSRPIVAHVRFHEGGPVFDVPLTSWSGTPDYVSTNPERAPKLKGQIEIPKDADWVEVWVTYQRPDGAVLYDSSFGRNFRFRFYHRELEVLQSDVLHDPGAPLGKLVVRVATTPNVERVMLRYRVLTDPLPPQPTNVNLQKTATPDTQGRTVWETRDVAVPPDRVVAYDFVYFVDGRPFKDNNQGQSFLAVDPAKRPAVAH